MKDVNDVTTLARAEADAAFEKVYEKLFTDRCRALEDGNAKRGDATFFKADLRVAFRAGCAEAQREASTVTKKGKPRIVTLCGSTRFKDAFDSAYYRLTMGGKIVLSVGFYPQERGVVHNETLGCTADEKIALDILHKQKIDISDEVFVLNVGGYIGESTKGEIDHANRMGKPVYYLEESKP